jgi:hypothetical protein
MPSANAIIEWHRPMGKRGIAFPLVIGATLMTVGGLCVLLSLPRATSVPYLAGIGGIFMVASFAVSFISLMRRGAVETCLILRRDAIVLEQNEGEIVLVWDEVKAVRAGKDGAIDVERKDGTLWTIDEGFTDADKLVSRMEEVRRKIAFGLM